MSAEVCDRWRAAYDATSFEEQVAFYDEIAAESPEQQCFDQKALRGAFLGGDVRTVTEIGGWRGEGAASVLEGPAAFLLERWTNYEVCSWAALNPRCRDSAYEAYVLRVWPWEMDLPAADLFVASHVLEHMRFRQLDRLAEQFRKFKMLHLQIPLPMAEPPDWDGYDGTHILEASWKDVDALVRSHGFRVDMISTDFISRTYMRVDG